MLNLILFTNVNNSFKIILRLNFIIWIILKNEIKNRILFYFLKLKIYNFNILQLIFAEINNDILNNVLFVIK